MQLKLCHNPLGSNGLPLYSYLRVHELHEVPRSILTETIDGCKSKALELQEKSYWDLQHYLRSRGRLPS